MANSMVSSPHPLVERLQQFAAGEVRQLRWGLFWRALFFLLMLGLLLSVWARWLGWPWSGPLWLLASLVLAGARAWGSRPGLSPLLTARRLDRLRGLANELESACWFATRVEETPMTRLHLQRAWATLGQQVEDGFSPGLIRQGSGPFLLALFLLLPFHLPEESPVPSEPSPGVSRFLRLLLPPSQGEPAASLSAASPEPFSPHRREPEQVLPGKSREGNPPERSGSSSRRLPSPETGSAQEFPAAGGKGAGEPAGAGWPGEGGIPEGSDFSSFEGEKAESSSAGTPPSGTRASAGPTSGAGGEDPEREESEPTSQGRDGGRPESLPVPARVSRPQEAGRKPTSLASRGAAPQGDSPRQAPTGEESSGRGQVQERGSLRSGLAGKEGSGFQSASLQREQRSPLGDTESRLPVQLTPQHLQGVILPGQGFSRPGPEQPSQAQASMLPLSAGELAVGWESRQPLLRQPIPWQHRNLVRNYFRRDPP